MADPHLELLAQRKLELLRQAEQLRVKLLNLRNKKMSKGDNVNAQLPPVSHSYVLSTNTTSHHLLVHHDPQYPIQSPHGLQATSRIARKYNKKRTIPPQGPPSPKTLCQTESLSALPLSSDNVTYDIEPMVVSKGLVKCPSEPINCMETEMMSRRIDVDREKVYSSIIDSGLVETPKIPAIAMETADTPIIAMISPKKNDRQPLRVQPLHRSNVVKKKGNNSSERGEIKKGTNNQVPLQPIKTAQEPAEDFVLPDKTFARLKLEVMVSQGRQLSSRPKEDRETDGDINTTTTKDPRPSPDPDLPREDIVGKRVAKAIPQGTRTNGRIGDSDDSEGKDLSLKSPEGVVAVVNQPDHPIVEGIQSNVSNDHGTLSAMGFKKDPRLKNIISPSNFHPMRTGRRRGVEEKQGVTKGTQCEVERDIGQEVIAILDIKSTNEIIASPPLPVSGVRLGLSHADQQTLVHCKVISDQLNVENSQTVTLSTPPQLPQPITIPPRRHQNQQKDPSLSSPLHITSPVQVTQLQSIPLVQTQPNQVTQLYHHHQSPVPSLTSLQTEYNLKACAVSPLVERCSASSQSPIISPIISHPIISEPITSKTITLQPINNPHHLQSPITSPIISQPTISEPITSKAVISEPISNSHHPIVLSNDAAVQQSPLCISEQSQTDPNNENNRTLSPLSSLSSLAKMRNQVENIDNDRLQGTNNILENNIGVNMIGACVNDGQQDGSQGGLLVEGPLQRVGKDRPLRLDACIQSDQAEEVKSPTHIVFGNLYPMIGILSDHTISVYKLHTAGQWQLYYYHRLDTYQLHTVRGAVFSPNDKRLVVMGGADIEPIAVVIAMDGEGGYYRHSLSKDDQFHDVILTSFASCEAGIALLMAGREIDTVWRLDWIEDNDWPLGIPCALPLPSSSPRLTSLTTVIGALPWVAAIGVGYMLIWNMTNSTLVLQCHVMTANPITSLSVPSLWTVQRNKDDHDPLVFGWLAIWDTNENHSACLIGLKSPSLLHPLLTLPDGMAHLLTANSHLLATESHGRPVLWSHIGGCRVMSIDNWMGPITSCAFHPSLSLLAFANKNGTVHIYGQHHNAQ